LLAGRPLDASWARLVALLLPAPKAAHKPPAARTSVVVTAPRRNLLREGDIVELSSPDPRNVFILRSNASAFGRERIDTTTVRQPLSITF
jgi:hypothetical protein